MSTIPESISVTLLSEAMTAFCEALGINPGAMFFPLVVTEREILIPMVYPYSDAGRPTSERVPEADHPQGLPFGERSVVVRIEVER